VRITACDLIIAICENEAVRTKGEISGNDQAEAGMWWIYNRWVHQKTGGISRRRRADLKRLWALHDEAGGRWSLFRFTPAIGGEGRLRAPHLSNRSDGERRSEGTHGGRLLQPLLRATPSLCVSGRIVVPVLLHQVT